MSEMTVSPPPANTGSSPGDVSGDHAPPPTRRKGGQLYFVSAVFGQVVALLRYVTLARLLGPEQLGLAAALMVTAAFFELIADTGSDRFLIQDRDGDKPELQALVQLVYVGRGFAIAAGLILFSGPIAAFYGQPRLAHGLVWLGLPPLIVGFMHLDLRRVQRDLDYRPEATGVIVGEAVSLIATAIAAWFTREFTAILYGLTARSIAIVIVSHFTAERPYRLAWSRFHAPRLSRFSGPLMLSGLLLFIGTQGDRVLVANQLGAAALGEYSAVSLLIYYPSAVLVKYLHMMYMPMVANARDNPPLRDKVGDKLGGETLLLAISMAAGFALVTPFVVTILYGQRFAQPALLIGLVGILFTVRFVIVWPSTVALSMGSSVTVFLSNFSRLLVFPCAFIALRFVGGLNGVVSGFIVGEAISICVALALLNRDTDRRPFTGFVRYGTFLATSVLIVAWNLTIGHAQAAVYVGLAIASLALAAYLAKTEFDTVLEAVALVRRTSASIRGRIGGAGQADA